MLASGSMGAGAGAGALPEARAASSASSSHQHRSSSSARDLCWYILSRPEVHAFGAQRTQTTLSEAVQDCTPALAAARSCGLAAWCGAAAPCAVLHHTTPRKHLKAASSATLSESQKRSSEPRWGISGFCATPAPQPTCTS